MKVLSKLAFSVVLSTALALSSCSNEDGTGGSADSSLESSPIFVTEDEFYAARFNFEFVTAAQKIVKLVPYGGSGTGGNMPGYLTVDSLSIPVTLTYDLQGDFLDLENADDPEYDAIGIVVVTFTNGDKDTVEFFKQLGVNFADSVDDPEFTLPDNSMLLIEIAYLDPRGVSGVATAESINPLGALMVTWVTPALEQNTELAMSNWIETSFLQGSYKINRNK